MLSQLLYLSENLICSSTTLNFALNDVVAKLPMFLPVLIFELLAACLTLELAIIKRLFHESIKFGTQTYIRATIRARVFFGSPLGDARSTAQLIALETLLGVFDDHEANGASEIGVHGTNCVLGRYSLISVNICFEIVL